jgi:protoheme IX farnesyltransferase
MLPAVVSLRATSVRILIYTVVLWACTVLFSPVAAMGNLYLGAAIVLGGLFTWLSFQLTRDATPQKAMRLFGYSITYITLLFGAMAADQLLRSGL